MRVVIQFSKREEAKALPILLRHSPGAILRDRTLVLNVEAVQMLSESGVRFIEVGRDDSAPGMSG